MNKVMMWVCGSILLYGGICCTPNPSESADTPASGEIQSVSAEETPVQVRIVDLSPDEFEQKLSQIPEAILIDARTPAEFALGHIPGAINIDVKSSDFLEQIQELDPDKPYLVNCKGGFRSTRACTLMKDKGFSSLYNLEGGILAWEKEGKEIVKP